MDLTFDLPDMQAEAETMMNDQCIITRPAPENVPPVLDPVTGLFPELAPVEVYIGKCTVLMIGTTRAGRAKESAGDTAVLLLNVLSIPISSPPLKVQDVVLITDSTFNPVLVGAVFTVSGLFPGSHVTKQKVMVEAVID